MKKKLLLPLLVLIALFVSIGAVSATDYLYYGDYIYYIEGSDSEQYVCIVNWNGSDTELTVPSEINGLPVKELGSSCFKECSSLESISIPEGVTLIAGDAFAKCTSLKTVSLPKSVTSVGSFSFECCTALESVILPRVTTIGEYAFHYCSKLSSVELPSVVNIENYAFYGCPAIEEIFLPKCIKAIGNNSFDTSLKTVLFEGTETAWENVNKNDDDLNAAAIVYNVSKKNYSFYDRSGKLIRSEYGYKVASAPTLTLAAGETLIGWYDNPEFIGLHVHFPYAGTSPNLYPQIVNADGKSKETAFEYKTDRKFKISLDAHLSGKSDMIWVKIVPPKSGDYVVNLEKLNDISSNCIQVRDNGEKITLSDKNRISLTANQAFYFYVEFFSYDSKVTTHSIEIELASVITTSTVGTASTHNSYKTYEVNMFGLQKGNLVILALYNGDTLAEVQAYEYTGEEDEGEADGVSCRKVFFNLPQAYLPHTYAKVFVWDSLEGMTPVFGEPELVY